LGLKRGGGGRRPSGLLYERSRHLVAYWERGALVLHDYASGVRATGDPLALVILARFGRPGSVAGLARRLPEYEPASLRRAVASLVSLGFLVPAGRGRSLPGWEAWGPAAAFYHFSTKDVAYVDAATSRRAARRGVWREPPPSFFKVHPGAPRVRLPAPRAQGELPAVLRGRRTWRRFARRPIALEELATLLGLSFGVQGYMDLGPEGRAPLKTSPSGGARHPIEAYVLALRVRGLPRGLYHYAARDHALERLRAGARAREVDAALPEQGWYRDAAALVLMTAVLPRVVWRYAFPRAYRVVLAEAGHVCQTLLLVATWLGLAPFCSMALADSRVERTLGIDGAGECVLYAAGVGTRRAGEAAPQRPPSRR
jgi:SagB-type dehydrogenase family enzyme